MDKENRVKLFVNELNDITEENIRDFAKLLIENADDYFFTVAASTSGKYHPQFDLGDGGLVRHTRCVAFFALCEATSRMFSEHETNLLIAAALAHDIKKLGDGKGQHTVGDHPQWAYNYIMDTYNANKSLLPKKDVNLIANMVLSHMGKWGEKDGMPLPKTELEKALQAADYIASRKELLGFDFRPTENVHGYGERPAVNESRNEKMYSNPGDYLLSFGKYSGKTIKEIYEIEKGNLSKGYLTWMVNKEDFNMTDARIHAMLYFKELGILPERFLKEVEGISVQENNNPAPVQTQPEPAPVEFKETAPEDDLPF